MRVILDSESTVFEILKSFSHSALSKVNPRLVDVKISKDRTPTGVNYFKLVKSQLDYRIAGGEKEIRIKCINGVPTIVKISKNV